MISISLSSVVKKSHREEVGVSPEKTPKKRREERKSNKTVMRSKKIVFFANYLKNEKIRPPKIF